MINKMTSIDFYDHSLKKLHKTYFVIHVIHLYMHYTTIYTHIHVLINFWLWIDPGIEATESFDTVFLLSLCALNMIAPERRDEEATTMVSSL